MSETGDVAAFGQEPNEAAKAKQSETSTVVMRYAGKELRFTVRKGLGFQALGAATATPIEFDCRAADCGICLIRVLENGYNLSEPKADERDFLKAMRADPDERLACQCRILGDITILVEEP